MAQFRTVGSASARKVQFTCDNFGVFGGAVGQCLNCRTQGGVLRSVAAFEQMPLSHRALRVPDADDEGITVLTEDGVYIFDDEGEHLIAPYASDALCFRYRDAVLLTGVNFGTRIKRSRYVFEQAFSVGFSGMTAVRDRLLGVVPGVNELYVSDPGDADNWVNAHHISVGTPCAAIASLGNTAYLLGDVCYEVQVHAESERISLAPIAMGIGNVSPSSVATWNDRVFFASDKGLFELKSGGVSAVADSAIGMDFADCTACCLGNEILFCCKDGSATYALDAVSRQIVAVWDCGADNLDSFGGSVYAVRDGKLFALGNRHAGSSWHMRLCGDYGKMHIKQLSVRTAHDLSVWIGTDCEKRLFRFKGRRGVQVLPVSCSGRSFDVELQSDGALCVDLLRLTAYAYGEV